MMASARRFCLGLTIGTIFYHHEIVSTYRRCHGKRIPGISKSQLTKWLVHHRSRREDQAREIPRKATIPDVDGRLADQTRRGANKRIHSLSISLGCLARI